MSIPRKHDNNMDPYLFTPGDLGEFITIYTGQRNAVTGEDLTKRVVIPGTAKFTGGLNADGAPTLAIDHPRIQPDDIPQEYPWPSSLGPDPRPGP